MPAGVYPRCEQCGSIINSWVVRVCHNCEQATTVTVEP